MIKKVSNLVSNNSNKDKDKIVVIFPILCKIRIKRLISSQFQGFLTIMLIRIFLNNSNNKIMILKTLTLNLLLTNNLKTVIIIIKITRIIIIVIAIILFYSHYKYNNSNSRK